MNNLTPEGPKVAGRVVITLLTNGQMTATSDFDPSSTMIIAGKGMAALGEAFKQKEAQKIQPATLIPRIAGLNGG